MAVRALARSAVVTHRRGGEGREVRMADIANLIGWDVAARHG